MSTQLFLTSSVHLVAKSISEKITTQSGSLKTAYITTPTERDCGDDLNWSEDNKTAMKMAGFDFFEYTITGKDLDSIRRDLAGIDVLYVEGGGLAYMLEQMRLSEFDVFVREFVTQGSPYIGTSTGSMIAATDVEAGLALDEASAVCGDTSGMGLVDFLLMPHWGSHAFKVPYQAVTAQMYHTKMPMVVLTDTQYLWVRDANVQVIDARNQASDKA